MLPRAWSGTGLRLITPLSSHAPVLLPWRIQNCLILQSTTQPPVVFFYPHVSWSAQFYLMHRPFEIFSANPSILLPVYPTGYTVAEGSLLYSCSVGVYVSRKSSEPVFYLINPLLNTAFNVRSSGQHWAGWACSSLSPSHPGWICHSEEAGGHGGDLNWRQLKEDEGEERGGGDEMKREVDRGRADRVKDDKVSTQREAKKMGKTGWRRERDVQVSEEKRKLMMGRVRRRRGWGVTEQGGGLREWGVNDWSGGGGERRGKEAK